MSKILYVCSRRDVLGERTRNKLYQICNQLVPDNVHSNPEHRIVVKDHVAYAVTMNNETLKEYESSVLLGFTYENSDFSWHSPEHTYPDGNFTLFRNTDLELEVVSDVAGSRTIWYYHDQELFIASTSQRAIILFIGTFSFDERVIPWMLSTGSLGPQLSWDKRLQRLQPDSALLLDKESWKLTLNRNSITFAEKKRSREEHKKLLTDAIKQTVYHLKSVDLNNWVLPLSGGYDSRAILCFYKQQNENNNNLKTVTWGLESSLNKNDSDAKIAKELSRMLNVNHEYYCTDLSSEDIEIIIERFIYCSEGRIDHLAGYMDGMEIWRKLHDNKIDGVIRGDVGFSTNIVSSELSVKLAVGCALCSDYENLNNICKEFNLPEQQLPIELKRRDDESFNAWRDRLYHSFRIPTILAALSDIKFSYVELINPLLSKRILHSIRSMPDELRNDKVLFKEIVNSISPNVSFAKKSATAHPENIIHEKSFTDLLKNEIESDYARKLFGNKFIKYISDGITNDQQKFNTRKHASKKNGIGRYLPKTFKNWLRDNGLKPKVESNKLAFRVFIIIKMNKILNSDANQLNNKVFNYSDNY